jgi:hypothetical protein
MNGIESSLPLPEHVDYREHTIPGNETASESPRPSLPVRILIIVCRGCDFATSLVADEIIAFLRIPGARRRGRIRLGGGPGRQLRALGLRWSPARFGCLARRPRGSGIHCWGSAFFGFIIPAEVLLLLILRG